MAEQYDVTIIGAGPGGYVAGIRAAQLGLKACVIEKDEPGGVCLNWGCIPSKSLIHQAEQFISLREMEAVGVTVDRSSLDYPKVQAKSRQAVKALTGGVRGLLKKNKVDLIKGTASIAAKGLVKVDGDKEVKSKNIIIATGSKAMTVPGFEFDEKQVLSSDGILAATELPQSMIILGAGAIGCEFAFVMNAFGVRVTLVEMAEHILPTEDFEAAEVLKASFEKEGIVVLAGYRAKTLKKAQGGVSVTVEDSKGDQQELKADTTLVVFGRVPITDGIGLKEVGVTTDERGYIRVGDYCETNVNGIFAIGDVTSTPALAHVASKEGEIAVEFIAGHEPAARNVDPDLVPSAIYCEPQVAGIGLREDQAKRDGIKYKKSVFPYRGAGKTVAVDKTDGLVKVLTDPGTGELLGAHIVGHNATELIHELLLAKSSELLPQDIADMIHAHPTISEAVMETLRGVDGQPIHM
ncbi:MAG: dihydrolipoyl dehydrogenase [Candidatus Tectomicrobia bacterium]|nr:dihydrolipoyl dehydrogenase [Candidatus Tectomicrobia bacterium]